MLERFIANNRQQHLLPPDRTVLLAVSGGRDSVAMADLCHRTHQPFAIAHCNFNLRQGDCDRDEAFVRQLAAQYQVPFHVAHFDTLAHAHGRSIEETARSLRYGFFARLCAEHAYPCVATAHHRDDATETFFLNLFRGTGIEGLRGIKAKSEFRTYDPELSVVRPMLCFSRAEIDAYIAERQLAYVEDHTNSQLDARRNRIRLQLMPLLRELYPAVDATMTDNLQRLDDVARIYRYHVDALRTRMLQPYTSPLPYSHPSLTAISIDSIRLLDPQRTLLYELLHPYGVGATMVDEILAALNTDGGQLFHTPTHILTLHRAHLLIAPDTTPLQPALSVDEALPPSQWDRSGRTIYADADRLQLPLRMRPWQAGDRLQPFGMRGSRLVSDLLSDLGLSRIEKQWVWIVEDSAGRIVWVAGLRADESTRITDLSRQVLRLSIGQGTEVDAR